MKTKTAFVSLLDITEALPFSFKIEDDIFGDDGKIMRPVEHFISNLEKNLREQIIPVGEDIIGEKFYYRYLFKSNGFMEIMLQPPVAIVAHFIEQKKAVKFSEALKVTIDNVVKEKKTAEVLKNVIEISAEQKEALSYKSWSKVRTVRGD
jgi:hypothetical protein